MYVNFYSFCLKLKFSIEKISTFLSIIFFVFNYSVMNKKVVKERCLKIFIDIMDFHSCHRPPFSYEIFNEKEKENLIIYVKNTFFRNYTLLENIFKFNVNIYLYSKDFISIPEEHLPIQSKLDKQYMSLIQNDGENILKLLKILSMENEKEKKEEKIIVIEEKSDIEKYEEDVLRKLNIFVNSFYKSKTIIDTNLIVQENMRLTKMIEFEVSETKNILEYKIPEIITETDQKVKLANNEVFKSLLANLNSIQEVKKK
jgi:hypothetical protein